MSSPAEARPHFAVCAPGLEALLAEELAGLGIAAAPEPGGAAWEGPFQEVQRANLHSRLATRVLTRVATFGARTFFELERHARRIEWERYLVPGGGLHLRVSCRKSRLYHEGAVAQRLRAAAEERLGPLGDAGQADEEGEPAESTQLVVVRFLRDRCTVSADTSGEPLYRRGYRQAVARAPLRETLAAALLRACGWSGGSPLLDPMCGSGTIPIEAALLARRIAPGLANAALAPRAFAFERWPEHDRNAWNRLVEEARGAVLPGTGVPIVGSDRDAGAIEAALANAARAGVESDVEFRRSSLSAVEPPAAPGLVLTNPPYGVRVSEGEELRNLYAAFGRLAGERLHGWTIALLTAEPRLRAQLRLPLRDLLHTRNGGIPVTLGTTAPTG